MNDRRGVIRCQWIRLPSLLLLLLLLSAVDFAWSSSPSGDRQCVPDSETTARLRHLASVVEETARRLEELLTTGFECSQRISHNQGKWEEDSEEEEKRKKKYDTLGIAGRFGKRLDTLGIAGRFG